MISLYLGILILCSVEMKDGEAVGLPIHGSSFTFYCSCPSGAHSKLDLFFISSEAEGWSHNVV